jgi:hypothetical protein
VSAALFDTRALKEPITALVVHGALPPNVPVQIRASTSADLENWTPVPVQGRVYRFDGEGAPANDRLDLRGPLRLESRSCAGVAGQEGVAVQSVDRIRRHRSLPPQRRPSRCRHRGRRAAAMEWELPFATPIGELEITTPARTRCCRCASWAQPGVRALEVPGHTVVYRWARRARKA